MAVFLTAEEVYELTGYKRWSLQVKGLERNRITHYLAASGRPIVPLSALDPRRTKTRAGMVANRSQLFLLQRMVRFG